MEHAAHLWTWYNFTYCEREQCSHMIVWWEAQQKATQWA